MNQQEKLTKYLSAKNSPAVFLLNEIESFQREQAELLKEFKQELLSKLEIAVKKQVSQIEKKEMPYSEVINKAVNKAVNQIIELEKGDEGFIKLSLMDSHSYLAWHNLS